MAWQCISPVLNVNGFKPAQRMRLMMICCGMAAKRMGILGIARGR